MPRYTSDQDKYYKGMNILIDLYYWYKNEGADRNDLTQSILEKYVLLFDLLLPNFRPFIFINREKLFTFLYNVGDAINVEQPGDHITRYFDSLILSIKSGITDHFKSIQLLGTIVRTMPHYSNVSTPDNSLNDVYLQETFTFEKGYPMHAYYIIDPSNINARVEVSDDQLLSPKDVQEIGNDINVPYSPYKHMTYEVEVMSSFARIIVDYGRSLRRYNSILVGIPYLHAPGYDKQLKYDEFLNGAFFGFYMAFGSFDRIKLCKNKSCEKLITEKRLGKKYFCSTLCRKQYHDSRQDPEKQRCREKQNAWIRNKLSPEYTVYRPVLRGLPEYHVFMDDCSSCEDYGVQGGRCKVLENKYQQKYEEIFAALRDKVIKKTPP